VRASTTKKTTMKLEMTARRYKIGLRYARIQIGPINIASPTNDMKTAETLSILWSSGQTVSSLRSDTMFLGAFRENQSLNQGMPLRLNRPPPKATCSKKFRPRDLAFGWIEIKSSSWSMYSDSRTSMAAGRMILSQRRTLAMSFALQDSRDTSCEYSLRKLSADLSVEALIWSGSTRTVFRKLYG
jgi:hypothetical protein